LLLKVSHSGPQKMSEGCRGFCDSVQVYLGTTVPHIIDYANGRISVTQRDLF